MEKGVLQDDDKQLFRCTCKSPQCAHCSLHEALMRDNLNELGAYIAEGEDKDSDALPHSESMHTMVDGAQSGAAKKLKLPCRRNSRSLSSSLAFPAHDRLSKSWPPLPLVRASSVDSVMYTDACVDLQKSEKKLDSSMLTITSSSFEDEQEIMSTHPVLLQHQFTPPKKSSKLSSSLQGATNPRRICRYCNREFPSGRALGGHMRVHGGLDADRLQVMNHPMPERQQFDKSMGRSSSPLANSKPGDKYAEVNCLVSGSKFVNSNGGGVFRRRINSEESIIRGADERKSAPTRGVMDKCVPVHHTAERDSLQKNEKLGKGIKDQSVIKKGGFTLKRESNFSVMQKSIDRYADDFTEKHVNDDDDGGYDDLYSSKLMVLGNASEVAPQGTMESLVSECVLDQGNPPHKLRPNPRPSRRCLWTDRGDAIADNNKESSGRRSSSPPTLHGLSADHVSSERARPCSECGKVFWSWKALFGHMRCHPEREWRGIQRPDASSSELDNKQARACRKLSSLSLLAGKDELETELESDAENRGACKPTQATLSVSTSAKAEGFNAHKEDGEEIELIKGLDSSKGAEGLQKAEESSLKGGAKRALKSTLLEEPANDDLAPSAWPTRKRSRRSRANGGAGAMAISTALAEPALTSETATSSELRDNEKVSIKDLQEDLDMANCLVLLSSAGNKVQGSEKHHVQSTQESALRKLGSGTNFGHSEHVDAVSCKGEGGDDGTDEGLNDDSDENEVENFIAMSKRPNSAGSAMKYECSTCKRCFKSHQALGGHRASHRKTKGCFALMNEHAEETMQESKEDNIADVDEFVSSELNEWKAMGNMLSVAPPLHHQQDEGRSPFILAPSTVDRLPATFGSKKKKFKGHACSICHRIFPSGQALGGHKRCHWTGEKVAESGSMAASSSNNNNNTRVFLQEQAEWGGEPNGDTKIHQAKRGKEDGIDLNLPAPLDEEDEAYDHAGLSSTDAMDPEVQNGVEGAELDGEEDTEGHLVDYIGGKRRSLNGLSREWLAEGGSRRRETAW